jgi:hypothetical protein
MPSPNLGTELVGDFTHDAARDPHELSHVVAEILGLLVGELEQLLEQLHERRRSARSLAAGARCGRGRDHIQRQARASHPNRGRWSPPSDGARKRVMLALISTLPPIMSAQDAPGAKIAAGVGGSRFFLKLLLGKLAAHATVVGDLDGLLAALHPFWARLPRHEPRYRPVSRTRAAILWYLAFAIV